MLTQFDSKIKASVGCAKRFNLHTVKMDSRLRGNDGIGSDFLCELCVSVVKDF
jgi:hypothetical protein